MIRHPSSRARGAGDAQPLSLFCRRAIHDSDASEATMSKKVTKGTGAPLMTSIEAVASVEGVVTAPEGETAAFAAAFTEALEQHRFFDRKA
jgi:hypothetical protein